MDKEIVKLPVTMGEALHMAESYERLEMENADLRRQLRLIAGRYINALDVLEADGKIFVEAFRRELVDILAGNFGDIEEEQRVTVFGGNVFADNGTSQPLNGVASVPSADSTQWISAKPAPWPVS